MALSLEYMHIHAQPFSEKPGVLKTGSSSTCRVLFNNGFGTNFWRNPLFHETSGEFSFLKITGEFPSFPVFPEMELEGKDPLLRYDNQDTFKHESS